jgi:hypothetical protein
MKSKYFFMVVLAVIFISCSSTMVPSGGQVTIPEDFFGIVHAARTRKTEEYGLLEQMECKWVLNTFYWHRIEPEKDAFDFADYDLFVSGAKDHGLKIIGVLGYSAGYLNPGGKVKYYISPENTPLFLRYVEETVRHYMGQVDVWCVWNEPNLGFWKGPNSHFYELSRLAAQKIRETDPNAYIIGGAFCRSPSGFIKKMHKAGAIEGLDALSIHPYAINPSGSTGVYDSFAKTLSEINYTGPVWVTEMGFPTGGWYPNSVSENNFPSYIVKTIAGIAARGARALLWYDMLESLDIGKTSMNSEKYFGLLYKDLSRKAGSWAFELCARYLPGSRYAPELPRRENIPSHIVSFCFQDGVSGNNTLILWNDRDNVQKIDLRLSSPALLHDISTGQNIALPSDAVLDVSDKPLIVTCRGTDVPLIVKKP